MIFFLCKQNGYLTKETDYFCYIDVLTIYASQTDNFKINVPSRWNSLRSPFEHSASCLSPSYTFLILGTIHHDSSQCDLHCKIGMVKTKKKITLMSHGVPTVSLRLHYDL